jgi:hypothetical protein
MRQIQQYELGARQCELFETDEKTLITVEHGVLWLTIEGEHADHWMRAGESIEIEAAQRLWISADADAVTLRTSQDRTVLTRPGSLLGLLAGALLRRGVRFFRRNPRQDLSRGPGRGRLPGLT